MSIIHTIKKLIRQIIDYPKLQEGTVKFFDQAKGFGFITNIPHHADIFVHTSGLVDLIRANDDVTFVVGKGPKGLNAVNVRIKK